MVTEIDLLKEDIPRLEIKFGRDNVFVELLRAELACLENQTVHIYRVNSAMLGWLVF